MEGFVIPPLPPTLSYQGNSTENFFVAIQEGEATRILCKYHANGGDEHDPLVVFEMAQIRHAVRVEKATNSATSWATLVSTPGNRKRMMIVVALAVFSQWRYVPFSWDSVCPFGSEGGCTPVCERPILTMHSGNGLVSYYIHLILQGVGVTEPSTQGAINGGLQVSKTPHICGEYRSIRS